LKYYTLYNI